MDWDTPLEHSWRNSFKMRITPQTQTRAFWILQIGGWSFLNLFSALALKGMSTSFVLFTSIAGTLIGIGATTPLRYFLKRKVNFKNPQIEDFVRASIYVIGAVALYALLNFLIGFTYGKLGPEISEKELIFFKSYNSVFLLIFSSLLTVAMWAICYLVIKLLINANQARIERLEMNDTLKEAQLNTLKGQINPHFMFNSLNNIRGLMLEDVDRARDMLTKLSEMLRYSLTSNSQNGITVEQELDMVRNYIELSKIQFEDRLTYEESVGKDSKGVQIPPMVIQLLVENGVKHGLGNLKEGGRIHLSVTKKDQDLHIEVRNTGKLQIAKDSTQLGLKNIRQRLKLLYGNKAQFELKEESDEVVARIDIPVL